MTGRSSRTTNDTMEALFRTSLYQYTFTSRNHASLQNLGPYKGYLPPAHKPLRP